MPRGDRTGPRGKGPKTGRGLGFCTGNKSAGYNKSQRRPRDGRGGSRGYRRRR